MAIGGALRAAIRTGRFGTAARESRRQARAVQSINERGGFRMAPEPAASLEARGYDRFMGQGYGETARGNAVVFDPYTGARTVLPQTLDDALTGAPMPRGPVAAPYEGVRVWDDTVFDNAFGPQSLTGRPPAWMGRGTPPPSRSFPVYEDPYSEFPRFGFPGPGLAEFGVDSYSGFRPYPSGSSFMNWNIPKAFGGQRGGFVDFGAPPPVRPPRRPSRFFFDDFA